jgi:hypothetical protein
MRLVAALCVICAPVFVARSSSPPQPSEFYIVSVGFSDAWPGWHRSVLEVRPDGADVLARYIRVMPPRDGCAGTTKIVATATRLPNTRVVETTDALNLCTADPAALSRITREFPQTSGLAVYAGDRYAIVAKCGTDTRVIPLPEDWKVDMARLKRMRPTIAALWALEKTVGIRAFGAFPAIDMVPPEMAARLQPATEDILAELTSGRFDAGLAPIGPRSFRDDVAALRSESGLLGASVTLVNADRFQFDRFVGPPYPYLAKQVRLSGVVELELTSNPATGEVEQVIVVSGSPVLAQAAKQSAEKWRLAPGTDRALHATRAVLEFRCP